MEHWFATSALCEHCQWVGLDFTLYGQRWGNYSTFSAFMSITGNSLGSGRFSTFDCLPA